MTDVITHQKSLSESPQVPQHGQFEADLQRVQAILDGDQNAWDSFLKRFSDRILWTAYQWCKKRCRKPCPVEARRNPSLTERLLGWIREKTLDCDELMDGYTFILDRMKNQVLPKYQGRSSLETYLFAVMNDEGAGHCRLHVDYVRDKQGRIHVPEKIKELTNEEQAVYKHFRCGWDSQRIAEELRISPDEVEEIRQRIEQKLLETGDPEYYWKHFGYINVRESNLSAATVGDPEEDQSKELEVPDPSADVNCKADFNEALGIFKQAFETLSPEQRLLLTLTYRDWMKPAEIAKIELMGRRMKPPTVYKHLNEALDDLRRALQAATPQGKATDADSLKEHLETYFFYERRRSGA